MSTVDSYGQQIPGHHFPPLSYAFALAYYASIFWVQTQYVSNSLDASGALSKKNTRKDRVRRPSIYRKISQGLALGLPSSELGFWNKIWNGAVLAVNLLLVLGMFDVVCQGPIFHELSFTRVGYVLMTTAKILLQEPHRTRLPVLLSYHAVLDGGLSDPWKAGGDVFELSESTDYTATIGVSSLTPSTRCEYKTNNKHIGSFTTAPALGARGNKLTFLTTSFIKPNFPYNPISDPLNIPSLHYLSNLLPSLKPAFMLFLGDFIYIDVPHHHGSNFKA